MRDDQLLEVLHDAATAVRAALDGLVDWGDAHRRPGQYLSDIAADAAALEVLTGAGLGAMSEESGVHHGDRAVVVVIDPVDGSTNASRGLPWFATSLCAVDGDGARAALVVDQVSGQRFQALRGGGASVDGVPLTPSGVTEVGASMLGLSGMPPGYFGWSQFRALGAVALDLCAVAGGRLDGYVDCSVSAHGSWDYLAGMLICSEAGACVADAWDRPLTTIDHTARRTPVAAGTDLLLAALIEARRSFPEHDAWSAERNLVVATAEST